MNNLRRWIEENKIKHNDERLLKILKMGQKGVGYIIRDGIKKVRHLIALNCFTGLTLDQLLNNELLHNTFVFDINPEIEKCIKNNIGDTIISRKLGFSYISIDFRAIEKKSQNKEALLERQDFVFKAIKKILDKSNVEYRIDYK